ncbi:MAG TPA: hypothetical protein DIC35_01385 [Candidatus Moranbacteria bacterium]|nr:hypothetical protein [Candidatus Moranbacteria bacterium]
MIRHLLEIDKENEYVLFFDHRVREKDVAKFSQPNVKIKFYPFSDYKKFLPGAYSEILGSATLTGEKLDVVHTTSPMSRIPVSYRGRTIVTVHDLAVYKLPNLFPNGHKTKAKAMLSLMISKADKVIAVSGSTKKDIEDIFSCPDGKTQIIYSGFDKRFSVQSSVARDRVLEKYGIGKNKYILFLGTLEAIKNIGRLFKAFKLFRENCEKNGKDCEYKLVMAGKDGWMASRYRKMASDLGISDHVIFTGYVVGDDMVPLFSQADFFVMPSLYEGFGTTVLEAFATGTPAIVSNVSSIPEIAGQAARLVDPVNVEEIAISMIELAGNEKIKQDLREKGRKQVEKFNWEKCARETLEVYRSACKKK